MQCGILAAILLSAGATIADPLVKTVACGAARGVWITNPDGSRVAVWKSLPYAAPPLGDLRWAAPTPPTCWSGTYDASAFRSICVQPGGIGSEDCLYLHVHVPEAVANGSVPDAVPVWAYIHGGGLMEGSGQFEPVDPFAAHAGPTGVIIVTMNYRLNIFGFLASSELTAASGTSGNYGILDQQAALRWVRDNVAAFGGDPARVTLGGQSSGGTSIFALLASPASRGLFAAAISLSGSINVSLSLAQAHVQNAPIVAAAGCTLANATAAQRVACLRGKSVAELAAVVPASWNTPGLWGLELLNATAGMQYAGLPVVDGTVVTHSFADALAAGLVDVPLIFGNMGQEADFGPDQDVHGLNTTAFQALLNASLAAGGWTDPDIGARIYAEYAADAQADADKAYCSLNADYGLTCGSVTIAVAAKAGGAYKSPIYLYVNQWPPSEPAPLGLRYGRWAYHTWDYNAAIESWPGLGLLWTPGPQDLLLSRTLQATWYELMANGSLAADSGWVSVEQAPGFPAHYATNVLAPPQPGAWDSAASTGGMVRPSWVQIDYKAGVCGLLAGYGFDARFWWCD